MRKMRTLAQLHTWGCSRLQLQRESGGDKDDRVTRGADFSVHPTLPVAKLAPKSVLRHNPHADFVGYEDRRTSKRPDRVGQGRDVRVQGLGPLA